MVFLLLAGELFMPQSLRRALLGVLLVLAVPLAAAQEQKGVVTRCALREYLRVKFHPLSKGQILLNF